MNEQLQVFIHQLDHALTGARKAIGEQWAGICIASLQVVLEVMPEPGDSAQTWAFRVGGGAKQKQRRHELSIELPADAGAIVVRFDGQLFGHYRRLGNEQTP